MFSFPLCFKHFQFQLFNYAKLSVSLSLESSACHVITNRRGGGAAAPQPSRRRAGAGAGAPTRPRWPPRPLHVGAGDGGARARGAPRGLGLLQAGGGARHVVEHGVRRRLGGDAGMHHQRAAELADPRVDRRVRAAVPCARGARLARVPAS